MFPKSQVRQNYDEESEAYVNKQINMELYASYTYLSMSYFFDRDDVALPGFAKFFKEQSDEERCHAEKFMKFQNQRGGHIVLKPVSKPDRDEWGTGLDALQAALALERSVNESLLELHKIGGKHNDPQMCDFIENDFLTEQVESIKQISDLITRCKRCGSSLGEYIFDKDTMQHASAS